LDTFRKYFKKITKQKASNIKVVVLCVLAATTFWILNALNKDDYTTVVDQPIEFYYNRQAYMAIEELPSKVSIEIHGNGWDLLRKYFKLNVVPFPIELRTPNAQEYLLTNSFQRALAEQTAPTQLSDILEDTLKINIDTVIEENLKVELDTSVNTLASNHRFASEIKLDPDSVSIKGPASIIEKMEGTISVQLEEDNIMENYSQLISVSIPDQYREFLTLNEELVHVEFEVVGFLEGSRELEPQMLNFPASVSLEEGPSTVTMEYLIDERELEEFQELELEALLNYNNRNKEDSTVSVQLNIVPAYLDSVSFMPENFKLVYE
jgi:hypothetical protein